MFFFLFPRIHRKIFTPKSVQYDNFENQIVLLDQLLPKKNCPGQKEKMSC